MHCRAVCKQTNCENWRKTRTHKLHTRSHGCCLLLFVIVCCYVYCSYIGSLLLLPGWLRFDCFLHFLYLRFAKPRYTERTLRRVQFHVLQVSPFKLEVRCAKTADILSAACSKMVSQYFCRRLSLYELLMHARHGCKQSLHCFYY